VSVAWVPGAKGDPVRVAYAVGRRTGAAVVRNRLRRRLRAIVADAHRSDAGLRPGAYLIGASAEAIPLCPNELKALVNQALQALSPASTQNP
jgi:ribonuclease P protein component